MENPFSSSTRYKSRYRKAGLLLLALALAAFCAHFTPSRGQAVQAMVKNQPFPYPSGVAMDTLLYSSVKAKLQAAELVKTRSAQTIATLQTEIRAIGKALIDQQVLGQHDAKTADSLRAVLAVLITKLQTAGDEVTAAQKAINQVLAVLPRSVRILVQQQTPDQQASAVTEYVGILKARKWKWLGAGAGMAFVFTLLITR